MDEYNFPDDFRKSIDYCYEQLRKQPPHTWPRVLTKGKKMSEFGNPFEGTTPPLPLNGPEPAKRKGRPKGVPNKKKVKPVKVKRGGRRMPSAPLLGRVPGLKALIAPSEPAPPSFAGSDNIAALLATLDEIDVKLFFDMYRAIQPREPGDRRTIVAALQAACA